MIRKDCWATVREYYRAHGKYLPFSYISLYDGLSPSDIDNLVRGKMKFFRRLPGPKPFALVTFYSPAPPVISHIGVVNAMGNRVIHYSARYGPCSTPIKMLRAVEGYYEYIGGGDDE